MPQQHAQIMCAPHCQRHRHTQTHTRLPTAGLKCKIVITTLILLLCHASHVLAIRKGRLMSPSTFTALSGDLHVQIQFSGDDVVSSANTTKTATTAPKRSEAEQPLERTDISSNSSTSSSRPADGVESITLSTLVISKYVDDFDLPKAEEAVDESGQKSDNGVVTSSKPSAHNEQVLQRKRKEIVQNIPLFPDPRNNVTQIAVPCQTFTSGGLYEMQVVTNLKTTALVRQNASARSENDVTPTITTTTLMPISDERLRQTLDVRWPSADMKVSPVRLHTYPESPVEVELRFPEVNCERAFRAEDLPEFWLELIYCGKERTCTQMMSQNISKTNILYAEQIRGFPKLKALKLACNLFGLAGNYAVQLRPMIPAPNVPITRRFLSVDWSDKFIFNVYARSIFPCDPHTGIGVLYEYPACILDQGDRVRVYAKLRADVASLKPPTSLHYVAEQRVVKSQYSLYFNCELFTEKYVEYCFVYVSQAISGAVADVRMDCVPTLPVSDSDTGGWGPWSEWTPCSTNCLGGTRNRYRFCDSPPPRYGAKFCEGPSVETEKCGKSITDTWDCIYETSGTNKTNRTEVSQEIGPGCRCGCIVHLGSSKPKRVMAGATQSCPGRSFWLIQVDGIEHIALTINFLRLPCASQYIKVRDGPSLSSTLLVELTGSSNVNLPASMESTGAQLLVEFHAGDESTAITSAKNTTNLGSACTGGFLANVAQLAKNSSSTLLAVTGLSIRSRPVVQKPKLRSGFTVVHLSAVVFASIIILISAMLGAQYVVRYRKYHIAIARRRDEGSRLHTPHASMSSLHSPPSRALSTTTLISEVFYLVKMRPKHQLRHSILRESVDAENLARETEFNDLGSQSHLASGCADRGSNGSIVTLRNEVISPITESPSRSPSTDGLAESNSTEPNSHNATLKRKDIAKDSESIVSSGMSSICNSPALNSNRLSKYSDRYDTATLKIRNSHLDGSSKDCDSLHSISMRDYERLSQLGSRSASVSLTNGYYSPAASVVSTATIRTTNPKESKEKHNRRKLMARPGSEFSLGNQEELELDYYDYNVINAGAAPGSYLGMDPAHLIWIPPFDDATGEHERDEDKTPEPLHEPDETEPLYEEIKMPKYGHYLSTGSNAESSTNNTTPTSDELSPLSSNAQSKVHSPSETNLKNCLIQQAISISNHSSKQSTPYFSRKDRRKAKQQSKSTLSLGQNRMPETISMHALGTTKSNRNVSDRTCAAQCTTDTSDSMTSSYIEKETTVEKSPSDLQNFLALDDIQFADDSESDYDSVAAARTDPHEKSADSTAKSSLERAFNSSRTLRKLPADNAVEEKCLRQCDNVRAPTSGANQLVSQV